MINLNDLSAMKKLDTVGVIGSIEQLSGQCQQAWDEVRAITFPDAYKKVTSIVFSGMGGSALGAYVVKSLFYDKLPVPFEIVNDYHLPPYVNEKTLVILASYSGTTEETLSCAQEAIAKHACTTGLTVGGKLADLFTNSGVPAYVFDPRHNPSNQPRLGTGYSVFGQIAMLNTLGPLSVVQSDAQETFTILDEGNKRFGIDVKAKDNRAKQLAQEWYEKIPVIVAAEFLTNVGRVIRNQIHESAKTFSAYHEIPELNHHLMEGLTNPMTNKETLRFLFIQSNNYSDRIAKRFTVTKEVVKKQGIAIYEYVPTSISRLAQAFECIQFGAYVNYYMAMLYDLDPSKIPWVDYFKEQMARADV